MVKPQEAKVVQTLGTDNRFVLEEHKVFFGYN